MTDKRAKKAKEEAKEAQANEIIRRKAGRVRPYALAHIVISRSHPRVPRRIWTRSKKICKPSNSRKTQRRNAVVRRNFPAHIHVLMPSCRRKS